MLLLVLPWNEEAEASPEWWYLRRWLIAEARAAYERVDVLDELPEELPPETNAVLALASHRVLIGRRSISRMRDELAAGTGQETGVVYAAELTATGPEATTDLFTLVDFEQAEAAFLNSDAQRSRLRPANETTCPAVMLSPRAARQWADRRSDAAKAWPAGPQAGFCYEFNDYYGGERADVIPLLPPDLGSASSVLEVGCGRGATGALIRARFGCRVVGIELHPEAASHAESQLDRVIQADVQNVEPGETFDAVVAFELFEHLTDGQALLERAVGWLRPGGRMVFSVPNVGHYSIVEDLIAGRWDYVPMGILCATHFRFFTRRTLETWLHAAGLNDYRIDPQRTTLPRRIDELPATLRPDRDSLRTSGFYVSIFV